MMKYTAKSLNYIFRNLGWLVLFGLFPAVFLAYSIDTVTISALLRDYFSGRPYASFSDIFHSVSIFNFRSVSATHLRRKVKCFAPLIFTSLRRRIMRI